MTKSDKIIIRLVALNPDALIADGFDSAIVGISADLPSRAVYDVGLCIKQLESQGMTFEDANEYFWFNTADAYVGVNTPLYMDACNDD